MPWVLLVIAGLFEVGFTTCMKLSDGVKRPGWLLGFAFCATASFALLWLATQRLPLGTAYAVWTGIGAVGTVLVGILAFGESASPARLLLLAVIVGGVVGLKFVSE